MTVTVVYITRLEKSKTVLPEVRLEGGSELPKCLRPPFVPPCPPYSTLPPRPQPDIYPVGVAKVQSIPEQRSSDLL